MDDTLSVMVQEHSLDIVGRTARRTVNRAMPAAIRFNIDCAKESQDLSIMSEGWTSLLEPNLGRNFGKADQGLDLGL
jgi:hypothetical protein